ncbi:MAG: phenylacetate--CoA ligase family protein [Candidatus Aminicenantes bacterium]|nr:phenylacetate--CoA ligase family protein [Candidatus Aminicenantes bacterium]
MYAYQLYDFGKILKAQRLNPDRLAKLQSDKLSKLIRHSYAHVPYVRNMLDARGIVPGDVARIEDIGLLPLTDKSFYQSLKPGERAADNLPVERCKTFQTSGTTGLPLRFHMTRRDFTMRNLNSARAYLASGYEPWQRMAVLAGDRVVNEKRTWNEKLGFWRRREISSWKDPEQWLDELETWKPHVLVGRVTTLVLLAEAFRERPRASLRPKRVFASAEVLDDASRNFLATTFGCPVLDFYFTFEGGCLAWECPACGGYHMNSDMVIIEVLRNGNPVSPGEEGEVVITNLHAYAMPLIRYRQGDSVVLSRKTPRCGRGLPLLDRIYGRKEDLIVLRNGRRIPPQAVPHVFIPVPGIRKWQVVQPAVDRLKILIEPKDGFDESARRILLEEMMKLLRDDVRLEIIVVDSLERDREAKFRPIVSEVKKEAGQPEARGAELP